MIFTEIISGFLIIVLCCLCTISDLRYGIIRNKVLAVFCICAILLDIVYYGVFTPDLFSSFFLNFVIVSTSSLFLFFTHSFAGGDCKMIIVLAMFYPARCYLIYDGHNTTLLFVIAFAIFGGYCYLLVSSIYAIIAKKTEITLMYFKDGLLNFAKSYITAMTYIALLSYLLRICGIYETNIGIWITRILCIAIALCIGRFKVFRKSYFFVPAVLLLIVVSIIQNTIPFSFNLENYTLVLILLLCQMIIRTTIYETIDVENLNKGMILSTISSLPMQSSITPGLPGISTEDLKSRLSIEEIQSIKLWAKATHVQSLTIVKKIPFGIFISIGFIFYWVLWGVLICL